MPVDAKKKIYQSNIKIWERARDCYAGSDAVKAGGPKYLPPLDSHQKHMAGTMYNPQSAMLFNSKYLAYVERALFYNATAKTVDGLAGFVFQKEPDIDVSNETVEEHLKDITMTGVDAPTFALKTLQELLLTGRYGILVDVLSGSKGKPVPPEDQRPYWAGYRAEDIISWTTQRIGGDPSVLTRVVLREAYEEQSEKDQYEFESGEQYLVLELEGYDTDSPKYTQSRWRRAKGEDSKLSDNWVKQDEVIPERHGEPLDRIPFQFIGTSSLTAEVQRGPLADLVDLNISHYRTMADLEHGRHFTALPTPWTAGLRATDTNEPLSIGSGTAWDLEKGGQCGMLEFSGAGLLSLVTAEQDKRKMMAILGARLLEEQPGAGAETATAIMMRHASEGATLRTLVATISEALTRILRIHEWWLPGVSIDTPQDLECTFILNREFFAVRMNAQEVQTQLQLLQAEAISYETFYYNITVGGWTRPGIESEEEKKQIADEGGGQVPGKATSGNLGDMAQHKLDQAAIKTESSQHNLDQNKAAAEMGAAMAPELGKSPQAGGPGVKAGDVVAHDEGPYKIIQRKGKFVVIKADTGKPVGNTAHGTLEEAKRYLAALHMHAKE